MASKIGKSEWKIVYVLTGLIDIIQWALDFTGAGAGVNEVADPVIGVGLTAYFTLRGVPVITQPKRILSLLAADFAEQMSVSVFPAWVIDVWYIHKTVKAEEAQEKAQKQQEMMMRNINIQPMYKDGVRMPPQDTDVDDSEPLNQNGIRRVTRAKV